MNEINVLYNKLKKYSKTNICPMHMPGHKRNSKVFKNELPYNIDITEIDGFDNLHDAKGVLKESMDFASNLYKSKRTFYSINGSTACILACIRSVTKFGDKIIIARNCHKSVYNAIELMGLKPVYILPSIDKKTGVFNSITKLQIEKTIKDNLDASMVVITSPTYEGVISDVKSISKCCHKYNIPLMVDEAHGAHLFLQSKSAVENGADLVINSLHKTLPSLTQTAIVHVSGKLIKPENVEKELAIFETSSPSYILLSSIDSCIRLMKENGEVFNKNHQKLLANFSEKMKRLKNLTVVCHGNDIIEEHKGFFDFDYGKIIISTENTDLSGADLMNLLRLKYDIECEMAYTNYALAMTTLLDTKSNFDRLINALLDIDKTLNNEEKSYKLYYELPEMKFTSNKTRDKDKKTVRLKDALGKVSGEYIWVYPPGIPLLVPGEIISTEMIDYLQNIKNYGLSIKSTYGNLPEKISIID